MSETSSPICASLLCSLETGLGSRRSGAGSRCRAAGCPRWAPPARPPTAARPALRPRPAAPRPRDGPPRRPRAPRAEPAPGRAMGALWTAPAAVSAATGALSAGVIPPCALRGCIGCVAKTPLSRRVPELSRDSVRSCWGVGAAATGGAREATARDSGAAAGRDPGADRGGGTVSPAGGGAARPSTSLTVAAPPAVALPFRCADCRANPARRNAAWISASTASTPSELSTRLPLISRRRSPSRAPAWRTAPRAADTIIWPLRVPRANCTGRWGGAVSAFPGAPGGASSTA